MDDLDATQELIATLRRERAEAILRAARAHEAGRCEAIEEVLALLRAGIDGVRGPPTHKHAMQHALRGAHIAVCSLPCHHPESEEGDND